VPFDFYSSSVAAEPMGNWGMRKRAIRIVKHIGATPCIAACIQCGQQFNASRSEIRSVKDATASLQFQFDLHECKPSGQDALRTMRETAEGK
jgi:hypothetical protein